jgi:hypothetical protein
VVVNNPPHVSLSPLFQVTAPAAITSQKLLIRDRNTDSLPFFFFFFFFPYCSRTASLDSNPGESSVLQGYKKLFIAG